MLRLQRNIIVVVVLVMIIIMQDDSADLFGSVATKTKEFVNFASDFGSVISFAGNIIIQSIKLLFV